MTDTSTNPQSPADLFMDLIVAFLAPMFLSAAGGDIAFARAAAIETVNTYRTQSNADLLCVAQMIGFGLAALGSLSLSMADTISPSMVLRLRANAVAANRASEQCRRALAQPVPRAAPIQQNAVSNPEAGTKPATQSAGPPQPTPAQSRDPGSEAQRRKMWAGAMADVAAEVTADLPNLPPAQRREASMRAAALSSVARDLLAGNEGQFPAPFSSRTSSRPG